MVVLIDADFKISERCCSELKKGPIKEYERKNNVVQLLA